MEYIVCVKPGSKKGPLVEAGEGGQLTVFVRERAIDGKANLAVVELLAKYFDVSKSSVQVVKGQTSRIKVISVFK